MRKQRTDHLIYAALVVLTVAEILSSPEHPLQQIGWLVLTASIPDATLAAAALGDLRYLDVPP